MRTLTAALLGTMLVAGATATQERRPQDLELQAAIRTATVEGDLEKAARQFAAIADTYKADRATAATALLHLAEVYQKRGDAQAKAVYERIVREFADQKDAATQARARLGATGRGASTAMSYRRIWWDTGDGEDPVSGTISADGRYLSYVNWTGGDLMLRDLATGTSRRLTGTGQWPASNEYAEQSAISRDGRRVAYSWFNGKDRYQLRVVDLRQPTPQPRTVLDRDDVVWVAPCDWLPDGRSVVVVFTRKDDTSAVAVVSLEDGSVSTVTSLDWQATSKVAVSPDGQHIAFDRAVGTEGGDERDVAVIRLRDGALTAVAPNPGLDGVVGWSPDGTRVLLASERGGTLGLWSQRFGTDGPASGPELLKGDIGHVSLGITADGDLFLGQQVGGRSIYVAEVDFESGRVTKPAERVVDRFSAMSEWPDWSPDGRHLSYVYARQRTGGSPTIAIRSLADNRVREIPLRVRNGGNPTWAPDGRSFVTQGIDADGRRGIHRIDARDGAVSPVVLSGPDTWPGEPQLSSDGMTVFFSRWSGSTMSIVEHDLRTGRERELMRGEGGGSPAVSPDGRSVVAVLRTRQGSTVAVVPLEGDTTPREIHRAERPVFLGSVSWAPTGRDVIATAFWRGSERREVWLIPLDGRPHRVIDVPGGAWRRIRIHPDGKRVAYHDGDPKSEVWVLENFLPGR